MTSSYVVGLYNELQNFDIKIWIDGGWAVDALLKEQTRAHEDLDIAIEHDDMSRLKEYLEKLGYMEVGREEDKKWDLVLGDDMGHEIEVHSFIRDSEGQVVDEECWDGYSRNSLDGVGLIDGQMVRCVSLEQIIKTHDSSKRKFKESDYKDMAALSKKLGVKRKPSEGPIAHY